MNRRSYLCLYVYDNSKEFKIGIAGFSIYGTKSEKLRFYLGSSSQNFFSPPKLKMPLRALVRDKTLHVTTPYFYRNTNGRLHQSTYLHGCMELYMCREAGSILRLV